MGVRVEHAPQSGVYGGGGMPPPQGVYGNHIPRGVYGHREVESATRTQISILDNQILTLSAQLESYKAEALNTYNNPNYRHSVELQRKYARDYADVRATEQAIGMKIMERDRLTR